MRQWLPAILTMLAGLAACGTPTPELEPSGFLGDYSQLREGRSDQAQRIYIDPEADFSGYERILIDPVVVWAGAAGADVSAEEAQRLADHFGAALRERLQLEFDLVERPSPGTLRLRSAITALRDSGASIELELLDAVSGKRLIAAADRGNAGDDARGSEWANAEEYFDFWANRARIRLAAFRDFDAAEAAHDATAKP